VWPYINIFFRAHGLSDVQIGILAALRPWVSAPASFLWSSAADRFQAHQSILLVTIILSTLLRTCMAAARTFPAFLFLAAVSEFVGAPTGVIADAAVVASCHKVSQQPLGEVFKSRTQH
jgi:sugar phosphate permease